MRRHQRRGGHRGERHRRDRDADARDTFGAVMIGEASGDWRRQRAGGAREAECAGRGAAEVERRAVQHHGERRPERAEPDGEHPLRERGAAQRRMTAPQIRERSDQRAVRQLRGRLEARQPACGHDADRRDAGGREREHRAPAGRFRHESGDDARQQDAEQQPRHHRADDAAAMRVVRERRGGRHDVLRHRRGQADREARGQQQPERRRNGRKQQRDDQRGGLRHDHAAPVEAVAERREQQDAERIAELRERGHEADRARRRAEIGAEGGEHRLRIVERRDAEAGCRREQQHEPAIGHRCGGCMGRCMGRAGRGVETGRGGHRVHPCWANEWTRVCRLAAGRGSAARRRFVIRFTHDRENSCLARCWRV